MSQEGPIEPFGYNLHYRMLNCQPVIDSAIGHELVDETERFVTAC